jgi:hypothetical protein
MSTTDWQTLFLSGRGIRQVGTILRGREILHEDSLAFTDDERIRLTEMTAANDQLGARTVNVRAGVWDEAVGPSRDGRIVDVGDDRVKRHSAVDVQVEEAHEGGVFPSQLINAAGQTLPERFAEESGLVAVQ